MKRLFSIVLALVLVFTMTFTLSACGSGECEGCGETASLSTFKYDGESAKLCSDCKELAEAFAAIASAFS
ncbi:MAG: hypothetical protein LBC86_08105 [Oscillospiraceae bacterium]|jgi:high-affinity K+ transport system ATPase subunit B|nr:hypothetical protein [Oscillospiraceae bacterium]